MDNNYLDEIVSIHESRLSDVESKLCNIKNIENDLQSTRLTTSEIKTSIIGIKSFINTIDDRIKFISDNMILLKKEVVDHNNNVDYTINEIRNLPIEFINKIDEEIDKKIGIKFNRFAIRMFILIIGGGSAFVLGILEILKLFKLI